MQPKLRLRDRRRRVMWLKAGTATAVVILLIVCAFYVSHLPNFQITEVRTTGASLTKADDVSALARKSLAGSYGFIVPRANAFVIPRADVERNILKEFPAISSVKISQKEPHVLSVAVTERVPVALWCGNDSAVTAPCYSLDRDGFIFAKNTDDASLVRYFGSLNGEPLGNSFAGFSALQKFVVEIGSTIHKTPQSVFVAANNDVTLTLSEGGKVEFVKTDDTPAILENMASVFASQSFSTGRAFEYADFRYGNKVYVKFKGE